MSKQTKTERPLFRVTFSRITGKDENGNDRLSYPLTVGAVWPKRNGKSGHVIALDLIPIELTQHQGVLFLMPVEESDNAAS